MKYKLIGFALSTFLALAAVAVIPESGGQEQQSPSKPQRRVFNETHFPIAVFSAPEPADPAERAKRRVRSQKYDKSSWSVNPEALSDSVVRVDSVDPNAPAFPIKEAKAILVGTVTEARAYLSNDKTGVYSSFRVLVDEVLQNSSRSPLTYGSVIEAEREGGRVKFPSGKLHLYMIAEQYMPHIGGRYVLFLTDGDDGPVFQILTGYELREGTVYPLDDLRHSQAYEKMSEVNFLNELKARLVRP